MSVKVFIAGEEHHIQWDEFVKNNAMSNVYHLYGWKRVIEDTYNHRGYYLMARDEEGNIKGILPIVKMSAYGVEKFFTSIPFFDLGGSLAESKDTELLLFDKCFELAKKHGVSRVCFREAYSKDSIGGIPKNNLRNFCEKKDKVRLILRLSKSSEDLFKSFKSKLRSQIRRPIKEGLEVKIGKEELVDDFYKVFAANMRFLGSPVHSKRIILNTVTNFKSAKIFTVYKEGYPIAASLVVGFKDTLYNPWASSLREYSRISPNMLLYWSMLKYGCDKGYMFFDFGRSTPGEGTYRFKKQWGAEDRPIFWYIFSNKKINMTPPSRLKTVFIRCWKTLPLSLTVALGPYLRRIIDL